MSTEDEPISQQKSERFETTNATAASRATKILATAFECAEIGAWTYDPATKSTWFSAVVFQQLGLPADAFPHRFAEFDRYVLAEHHAALKTSFKKLLLGHHVKFNEEIQVRHADGSIRWIESTARRVELDGKVLLCGAHVDVTERKDAEKNLAERLAAAEASERRFADVAAHVPGAIYQYIIQPDGSHCFGYSSPGFKLVFEIEPDQRRGDSQPVWDMVVDEDRGALWESVQKSSHELSPWAHTFRIITPSGKLKHLQGRGQPQRLPDQSIHYNSVIIDITEKVTQTEELEATRRQVDAAHERLINAIEALPHGFVVYDKENRITLFNEAYRELFSLVADKLHVGMQSQELLALATERGMFKLDGQDAGRWINDTVRLRHSSEVTGGIDELSNGCWIHRSDRRLPSGEIVGLRMDVTDLKAREQEMRQARDEAAAAQSAAEEANARAEFEALHDQLTACANRRGLMRRLEELDRSSATVPLRILSIDLDRFKPINDTYGHAAGDAILRHVADQIKANVRPCDFVARKGGDEFVVIVRGDACGDKVGQRIIEAASQPLLWDGAELRVGVSVGHAPIETGSRAEEQLNFADMALYKAKNDGRNRVAAFAPSMARAARDRLELATALKKAVEHGELEPFYQPQTFAGSGALRGAECLARWRREEGVVPPGAFLPIAEELKLTSEIDHIILSKSLAALTDLRAQGLDLPQVSVNVSSRRLRARTLIDEVSELDEALRRTLTFEVLESVFVDSTDESLMWTIDALKELGITIELDDFGSGHASIASIMSLKPALLKLDRMFAVGVDADPKALAVLRSLIGVARSFDVGIVAEGVETQAQLDVMTREGCDVIQGYFIAAPLPLEDFTNWLRAAQGDQSASA